jgi:hypothetical protein
MGSETRRDNPVTTPPPPRGEGSPHVPILKESKMSIPLDHLDRRDKIASFLLATHLQRILPDRLLGKNVETVLLIGDNVRDVPGLQVLFADGSCFDIEITRRAHGQECPNCTDAPHVGPCDENAFPVYPTLP